MCRCWRLYLTVEHALEGRILAVDVVDHVLIGAYLRGPEDLRPHKLRLNASTRERAL